MPIIPLSMDAVQGLNEVVEKANHNFAEVKRVGDNFAKALRCLEIVAAQNRLLCWVGISIGLLALVFMTAVTYGLSRDLAQLNNLVRSNQPTVMRAAP